MSVDVVKHYLDHSEQDGPRLLGLISLAEWADDTGYCFPGIVSIARRLRRSERTAQNIISELESAGELLVVPGGGLKTQGGYTTAYYLLRYMEAKGISLPDDAEAARKQRDRDRQNGQKGMEQRKQNKGVQESSPAKEVQVSAPLQDEKRGEDSDKGVQVSTQRGAGFYAEGVQVSSPKPSVVDPSVEPSVKSEGGISDTDQPAREGEHGAAASPPPTNAFGTRLDDARIVHDDPPAQRQPGWRGKQDTGHRLRAKPVTLFDPGKLNKGGYIPKGTGSNGTEVYLEIHPLDKDSPPSKFAMEQMNEITDLDGWRATLERCALKGWQPKNIEDRIDAHRNGFRNERNNGHNRSQTTGNGATNGRTANGAGAGAGKSTNGSVPGDGYRLDAHKLTAELVNKRITEAEYNERLNALKLAYGMSAMQGPRALSPS